MNNKQLESTQNPISDLCFNMHYYFGQIEDIDIKYFENLDELVKVDEEDPIYFFINSRATRRMFYDLVEKFNPEEKFVQNMIEERIERTKRLALREYEKYLDSLIIDDALIIDENDSIIIKETKKTIFELRILGVKLNKVKEINHAIDLVINGSGNIFDPNVLNLEPLYNKSEKNISVFSKLTAFNISLNECLSKESFNDKKKSRQGRCLDYLDTCKTNNKALLK